jgi:hypothetical protein
MKVSIKTSIGGQDSKYPVWVIRLTVKAGSKHKPAWTTHLPYTTHDTRAEAKKRARVLDQSVRHQFRADRDSVKSAASLRRWWYAHIAET